MSAVDNPIHRVKSLAHRALEKLLWHRHRHGCPKIRAAFGVMTPGELIYAVNISHRYRYVYMDNPKTGCSSLKSALVELEAKRLDRAVDAHDWRVFHDRARSPLMRLNDWRHPTSLSALVAANYRFITFVRNPYTRILSCYRDKIQKNGEQKRVILDRLGQPEAPLETPVSFADFVAVITAQSDLEMNPHWRVQSAQILFEEIPYAFIGRFERFDHDYAECFRVLGVADGEVPPLRHLNRTKAGDAEHCRAFYAKPLQDAVYERFRRDFDHFGYGYELPD